MYRQSIQFPVKDAALREDVHALGGLIGETLRDQGGDALFELVEGDRLAAIGRREGGEAAGAELQSRTNGRSPTAASDLTRAFSIWFQAVNTAEKVHRVRRRRQYLSDSSTVQPGGIADCIARLKREGMSLAQALELIESMSIEPVFTAHPTESTRRTIMRKQQRIAQDLLDRLNPALAPAELDTLWARVRLEITTIWQTEDHPREKLTVADEREHVLFYLVDILYRVVPLFYEEIEAALARAYEVPAESIDVPNILRFGSWVGGDMDGNPDVHGKTIRETLQRHRQLVISTYFAECKQLAAALSQSAHRVGVRAALAGRIVTGWLLDRFFGPRVACALLSLAAGGIWLLASASTFWTGALAAILIGLGLGGEAAATPYLLTRYFGLRSFSTLYGFTWTFYALAAAIGPVILGRAFDLTGSYTRLLLVLAAGTFLAAAAMLAMPRYTVRPPVAPKKDKSPRSPQQH